MQEGVAMEAVAFAGHQKLDNLILIYDSNAVTLDAMAEEDPERKTRWLDSRPSDGCLCDRRPRYGSLPEGF